MVVTFAEVCFEPFLQDLNHQVDNVNVRARNYNVSLKLSKT